MRSSRFIAILGAVVFLTAAFAHAQSVEPRVESDGRVHVGLTLETQSITVAYLADLSANAQAHQALLSGTVGSRIEVGTLEGHRALRIGSIAPDVAPATPGAEGEAPPSSLSYELWLARNAQGWELEARPAGDDDRDRVETIPLTDRSLETSSTSFTASLHATAAEAGRLDLRWGDHAWGAEFRFDELPPSPSRPRVSGRGTSRTPETDTTAFSRGVTMSERNESVLVLADGSRLATLFGKAVNIEDEDFQRVMATTDGEIVRLVRAPVLRLKTDVSLRFGQAEVPAGNLAPGFAGVYGVWLRRAGEQWRFVFNGEPDSWGTQHDAEFDVAEIDVEYSRGDGAFRPLAVTLVPASEDRGRLVVHWGPHEWSADFAVDR